jgi:hypothetical protein
MYGSNSPELLIEMANRYRLRLARVRCNENIARLESMLAFQQSPARGDRGRNSGFGTGTKAAATEPEAQPRIRPE